MKKIGYGKKNTKSGDYSRFRLWWTCPRAAKKVITSPVFSQYPDYIRESLKERMKPLERDYNTNYPPKIGLPIGMEFPPIADFEGKQRETADFIVKKKLIAIAIEKSDWDIIKPPTAGFVTDLLYNPLTKIPKK